MRSGWRSTIQNLNHWLLPLFVALGCVIVYLSERRIMWPWLLMLYSVVLQPLCMLYLVVSLPVVIGQFVENAKKEGAWNGWKRVQRAGLILLWFASIVGFVFTLVGAVWLARRGWVADWGLVVGAVLLAAAFVLIVAGLLVLCVGIVGSWLPGGGTRKRANDSADLE